MQRRVYKGFRAPASVLGLVTIACSWSVRSEQRQYALDRKLIAALLHNDTKSALALVNAGADPNTRYTPPVSSWKRILTQFLHLSPPPPSDSPTAFQIACGRSWYETALPASDPIGYPADAVDNPAANSVSSPADTALVREMLAHGADCKVKDDREYTPLVSAIVSNAPHVVRVLLEYGANANEPDRVRLTPLMIAALNGETEITHRLFEHGAKANAEDRRGNTALYYAVAYRRTNLVRLLLVHQADPR